MKTRTKSLCEYIKVCLYTLVMKPNTNFDWMSSLLFSWSILTDTTVPWHFQFVQRHQKIIIIMSTIITNFFHLHLWSNLLTVAKAVVRRQRWWCPQLCSLFFSCSTLYLAISSLMTGQPEGQWKRIQKRGGNCKRESKADNKNRWVFRMIMSVKRAIHWV